MDVTLRPACDVHGQIEEWRNRAIAPTFDWPDRIAGRAARRPREREWREVDRRTSGGAGIPAGKAPEPWLARGGAARGSPDERPALRRARARSATRGAVDRGAPRGRARAHRRGNEP